MAQVRAKNVFLFAGGGTGGHLYPAIAIAEAIRRQQPESEIHFVGTSKGLENTVIPQHGYPLHRIAVRGFSRVNLLQNFSVPFRLFWSLAQCCSILRRLKPCIVIGTGGYVSGPMLFMARTKGYPTLIQEQNSYPGVTTRLLSRWVDRVHVSFQDSLQYLPRKERVMLTGNPVRNFDLNISKENARKFFTLLPDRITLFIFGGSQGAQTINRAFSAILDRLMRETDLQILWSTGRLGHEDAERQAQSWSDRIKAMPFIHEMEKAYAAADLCIARAGAITLAEITLFGLPSILIPYPFAAANHQHINALALHSAGAAQVIPETELSPQKLFENILDLINDPGRRAQMGAAARRAAFPGAADQIVSSIFELAEIKGEDSDGLV